MRLYGRGGGSVTSSDYSGLSTTGDAEDTGTGFSPCPPCPLWWLVCGFADLQPSEARDRHRAAQRFVRQGEHVLDRHLRIADRRLIRQHDLLIEASELAFDDLVDHVRRLAGFLHLCAVDRLFLVEDVGRY